MDKFTFEILKSDFKKFDDVTKIDPKIDEFPVVYMMNNESADKNHPSTYVGETANIFVRINQHLQNAEKQKFGFDHLRIIRSSQFNKSAIYELETNLINAMLADSKPNLVNLKLNQDPHRYYQQRRYETEIFKPLWNELMQLHLVEDDMKTISNSIVFKYSPFKQFSSEQLQISQNISLNIRQGKSVRTVVHGLPGTGKSLMLSLIVYQLIKGTDNDFSGEDLLQKDVAVYLPQKNLRKGFSNIFSQLGMPGVDLITIDQISSSAKHYKVILVDEAHRLKHYFGKQAAYLPYLEHGKFNELDILKEKTDSLVLLYDETQSIRPADLDKGEFDDETRTFSNFSLHKQYRVLGGNDYLAMLQDFLEITPTDVKKNDFYKTMQPFSNYDFRVFTDATKMWNEIRLRNAECGLSRMGAGYSHKWRSKKLGLKGNLMHDEKIPYDILLANDFKGHWNRSNSDWVNIKNSIEEIGSIHTLQGVDLNYVGIIFGKDLQYDQEEKAFKEVSDEYQDRNGLPLKSAKNFDEQLLTYLKNVYFVLLTRGIKGCYVYFEDKGTEKHFKEYLSEHNWLKDVTWDN